ncbi:palmitoyltransferase ZDHHC21 isoform X3 [Equus asinus]|uniref:palmitoyltransferase ZDHHC21 isoform X3 n=1 Tax=Equus asinus TaxID=9793 RepID=UPI0038F7C6C4
MQSLKESPSAGPPETGDGEGVGTQERRRGRAGQVAAGVRGGASGTSARAMAIRRNKRSGSRGASRPGRDFWSSGPQRLPSRRLGAERRRRRRQRGAAPRGDPPRWPRRPGSRKRKGSAARPGGGGGAGGGGGGGKSRWRRGSSGGERPARRRRVSWRTVIEKRSICWDVIKKTMTQDKTSKCKYQKDYSTSQ